LNIPYLTHHDAGCDAEQCAKVYLKLSEIIGDGQSPCSAEAGDVESEFEDLYRSVIADGKVTVETGYEILRLFDSIACRAQIYLDFRRVMADVLADTDVTPGESELVMAMLKYAHNVLAGAEPEPKPSVGSTHQIRIPTPTFEEEYSFKPKVVVEQEQINIPDDFVPAFREIPKNYLEHWDEVREHPFTSLASANVVVTEDGVRISREEAERLIVRLGGNLKSSTSRVTDFCVVLGMPPERCNTTKVSKAREVQNQGSPIRILGEDEFIELVKESLK